MPSDIAGLIKSRLKTSGLWTDKTRDTGKWINQLTCSACGKPEAFMRSDRPCSIHCHRNNECGLSVKVNSLFPDLFQNIEKEYAPTKQDKHLPATTYLKLRGLSKSLEGLRYEYWPNIRKTGCGGVMFFIGGRKGKSVWNGRLFNPPAGEGKTHNAGSTIGLIWKHPGITYNPERETFVTEGIIDALSHIEMGQQAIAILAAGQDPKRVILSGFKKLVFAFDNDEAGSKALKKWKAEYPNAGAIMPERGDWNDFLVSDQSKYFNEKRGDFEFQANLAGALTAREYAEVYHERKDRVPGLFIFNKCYHWSSLNAQKDVDEVKTVQVSNFTISVDHYQIDISNPDEPIYRYFLKVKRRVGKPVYCSVSANEISSPNSLTTLFLQRAKALWEGDRKPSLALIRRIVEADAPDVRQLTETGYDKDSGNYVFRDFMIDQKGNVVFPNKKGFFQIRGDQYVRPAFNNNIIKPDFTKKLKSAQKIWKLAIDAWGDRAAITISFMVAHWFVCIVKKKLGWFPFLSLYNHSQTGKSSLGLLKSQCQCIDDEGIAMHEANTLKGVLRTLSQTSGLCTALLEYPTDNKKLKFDINLILSLFNNEVIQSRAAKTNDNTTNEMKLNGTLMFIGNNEPFTSKPQRERVISLFFHEDQLTKETTKAFAALNQIPIDERASFFVSIMRHRQEIENQWHEAFIRARDKLEGLDITSRIRDNHALVMAFHGLLCGILGVEHNIERYIKSIALEKQRNCLERPETIADLFLERVLGIENFKAEDFVDYRKEEGRIWIHLPSALSWLTECSCNVRGSDSELFQHLKEHPAYIESRVSHRFGDGKAKKSWVFDDREITFLQK